jgi:hypothetical protein
LLRDADGPVCVQAMKTKSVVLPLERAQHLALQRNRMRRQRVRRKAPRQAGDQGVLELPAVRATAEPPRLPQRLQRRYTHRRPTRSRYVRRRPGRTRR